MAGTTGLEPATSAVTVSLKPVTYRNAGQWMAPFGAKRHTEEPLLWPYCALNFDRKSARDLCRPAALVVVFRSAPLRRSGRGFGAENYKPTKTCPRGHNCAAFIDDHCKHLGRNNPGSLTRRMTRHSGSPCPEYGQGLRFLQVTPAEPKLSALRRRKPYSSNSSNN